MVDKQAAIDGLLNALTENTIPDMLSSSGQLHSYAFLSVDYKSACLSCPDMLAAKKELEVIFTVLAPSSS